MHICFITATMAGGGTERVIAVLANYFIKENNRVTILLTASDKVEYELDSRIEVHKIGGETGGSLTGRLKRIVALRRYYRKNKETVYLSFGTETNMFAILSSFFMDRKLIVSERNDPNKCTFKKKRNFLYALAKGFVFQTPDAMQCFSDRIQKRSVVIPNPVTDKLPDRTVSKHSREIVAVGRLEEQKNHKLLLEAYSEFAKKHSEFVLKMYGKGRLRQSLGEFASELGIEENVIFADFSPNVLEQIKDSYMYVLSSDYEGVSNSLLEAMAIGIPVISTDCPIGGSRMLIRDHENGILVPMGNKEVLADAMLELAENEELAERLSLEAIKTRGQYSVENIAQMWENLINNQK